MNSILIVKVGALGDVLRTTFLPTILKKQYPGCSVTWITAEGAKPLIQNNHLIDRIITLDKSDDHDEKFDKVISLDDEEKPAALATRCAKSLDKDYFTGAYIDGSGEVKYTENAQAWFGMGILRPEDKGGISEADRLKALNTKTTFELISEISGVPYNNEKPVLNVTEEEKKFGEEWAARHNIKSTDTVIGVNTGSGKRWVSKRWSIENTAELINKLTQNGCKVILMGGRDEQERNEKIKEKCEGVIDAGLDNSLREFSAIVNQCKALVTSDSLALHIASALNKHVYAIFGSTSAAEISTFGKGRKFKPKKEVCCFYKKECPSEPKCIDTTKPDEIVELMRKDLDF